MIPAHGQADQRIQVGVGEVLPPLPVGRPGQDIRIQRRRRGGLAHMMPGCGVRDLGPGGHSGAARRQGHKHSNRQAGNSISNRHDHASSVG
ncbi:hypothetical protein G6F64_015484 [Rhizopus arrhizus]|uniref:Uncharacterized protein n=1 Tax=Rhizopus oryzae TaxID=64495 RepID=A0A9P7BGV2_RHIOR|nr:hypothetical protein G6F64_015484 [Rhizopus arrhizus]